MRRISPIVALLTLCLSLSACTSLNKIPEPKSQQTKQIEATAAGATAGIAVAAAVGAPAVGVLGVGAAGAAIGYYLTHKAPHFKSLLEQAHGQIYTQGQNTTIVIPSDYLFIPNTNRLDQQAEPILTEIALILVKYPQYNILVTASTDVILPPHYAKHLSAAQAAQVAHFLVTHGIDNKHAKRKLNYAGLGSSQPIANPLDGGNMSVNRRVQITIYPNVG